MNGQGACCNRGGLGSLGLWPLVAGIAAVTATGAALFWRWLGAQEDQAAGNLTAAQADLVRAQVRADALAACAAGQLTADECAALLSDASSGGMTTMDWVKDIGVGVAVSVAAFFVIGLVRR